MMRPVSQPLTVSIPDALANVRYRLKRMAGADRPLSVDELAEVDELLAADAS